MMALGLYRKNETITLPEVKALKEKQEQHRAAEDALEQYRGKPTCTADGRTIALYGNIGQPEDVDLVLENDGEGIGLFRSEFLYLGREDYPTEDELFEAYCTAAQELEGRKLIIRTLDIGADKKWSISICRKKKTRLWASGPSGSA